MPYGLAGLALAWQRAEPLMGEMATGLALVLGAAAALVFAALLLATLLRAQRHPEAWAEDRRHPVRHTFIAALPIAALLLATVAVTLLGPSAWAGALWWLGALGLLGVTVWTLGRWWRPKALGGLQWASITPVLFIPIVGNVLVPLAGVPLGHAEWSLAQFGIGLMFWPVVLVLLLARILVQGPWPERLLPSGFILLAPPAVVGLSGLQLGMPVALGWLCWGMAVFCFLWAGSLAGRIRTLPFSLAHWALSFPLAALAALTLRLATPGSPMAALGPVLLALASIVVFTLVMGTVRGLRDGTLLAPEAVAPIVMAE
ncbi:C4-dicarboxylate ABC transporter [Ideonella sp.]|uniref:SLAC1 family transporter n=1 Tax=Ideonella sp. TaxID=1929293 RepID=UPI003BB59FB8